MTSTSATPPTDYGNGKIYFLRCSVDDRIYIGSTTISLNKRLYNHRYMSQDLTNTSKLYNAMREYDPDKFSIVLIENFPCSSLDELEQREFKHIGEIENPEKNLFNVDLEFGRRASMTGLKNPRFSGGCIHHRKEDRRYVAKVCRNNTKSFGYGVKSNRSQEQAYQLAEEWRLKEVAKLNPTNPAVNE